ncbi:thiamine-monophosphate kinase [Methylophilaceae bacterium]|nr:thiamine-monophosphate kinase [Methylophilaceae bacterium]
MPSEFELIRQYFTRPTNHTSLGVGDDAALIQPASGHELAISADMLVAGTHFLADTDPYQLGWKSLAVNISDMAAMGAEPRWATLALAIPEANEHWVAAFANGFFACAERFQVDLIGGDTTRGPLCISVQIMGQVPIGKAIRRDGAKAGDDVWVSGQLGNAALALNHLLGEYSLADHELKQALPALLKPQPRVELGLALRGTAHSAIDISDGLLADLGHILEQSNVGAEINLAQVPCSGIVQQHLDQVSVQNMLLAGGDDYELCFTAPVNEHDQIQKMARGLGLQLSRIGSITGQAGLIVRHRGNIMNIGKTGFDHFNR